MTIIFVAAEQVANERDVCVHHDEGQAVEAIRSSSIVPVKLSPVEAEGSISGIPQQALTRPNIETRAPFNVYFEVTRLPTLYEFILY